MGFDYSFEMWVPQERLYGFLELLNEFSAHTTPYERAISNQFFTNTLLFEPDEILSQSERYLFLDGKYHVTCIDILFDSSPENANWLDTEGENVLVSFSGQTKSISSIMLISSSIRQAMVNLARAGGAISCTGNSQIFYLDGKELSEEWDTVDYPDYSYVHFRDIRQHLNPTGELSENEKKLQACQFSERLNLPELMLRLTWAQSDTDSGVRAASIKSISNSILHLRYPETDSSSVREAINKSWTEMANTNVENILCQIALNDESWKVRYVAIHCLEEFTSELSKNILSQLIQDEHYEIRTIATKVLQRRQWNKY